jgi:imidazolonepropionase-like amidohydrolase
MKQWHRVFISLSILFLIGCATRPQWEPTSVVDGGKIISFAANGAGLFAGTEGRGVFRSTDGGRTWTSAGLAQEWVTALAANGAEIAAGTGTGGVFLSTDRGGTWTPAGLAKEWVTALAFLSGETDGGNLFAGTWGGGVFRSSDGGANWTAVGDKTMNSNINALAASGKNLFAGVFGGVFLTADKGKTWAPVNNGLTDVAVNALAVSGAKLFAGTGGGGVFLSTDNGLNWAAASAGLSQTNVYALAASGRNLFAGTFGGGVFLTTDDGAHWTAVNDGLTDSNVVALTVSPGGTGAANLLAATHGGVFRSTNDSSTWRVTGVVSSPPRPSPEPNPYESVKTIRAARILDGRGAVIENGVIEITETKITKIDQRTGPVTHDLGQATVLPGLIDTHVHITMVNIPGWNTGAPIPLITFYSDEVLANPRKTLLAGFTTVQSLGASNDKALRDAIAADLIVGPRILTSLYPIWAEQQSPEELRKLVRKMKADGADAIKFFASEQFLYGGQINVTQAQADAVCSEAKAQGLRCVVHAHSSEAIIAAVKAGCTSIEHGFFADDAAIQAMAKAGVYFDPNIGAALQVELENMPLPSAAIAKIDRQIPLLRTVFQKALAAGLRMPMGTDMTVGGHGQNAREIIARVEAGQTPMDAIIGATSLAAESLWMEKTIGTIAPGYEADIIAVGGDPLKDISALRNVSFVMKGGNVYKR